MKRFHSAALARVDCSIPAYVEKLGVAYIRNWACYMCGRFTQHLSWEELHRLADLIGQPRNLAPRYNIAPTTRIEVIRHGAGGKELVPMRWGLVPLWWKKPLKALQELFNF